MAKATLTRRVSEIIGVALFALSVVWLIALTTYEASDAVWFFNPDGTYPVQNFAGPVGAFLAELSYQLFGYVSFLFPVICIVLGWHYFWCLSFDAGYTKLTGFLLLLCFSSAGFALADANQDSLLFGGFIGRALSRILSLYFNSTGSVIVILASIFASLILTTQFSFGRLFLRLNRFLKSFLSLVSSRVRKWWSKRRRERRRRGVIKKHLDRNVASTARNDILAISEGGQLLNRTRETAADPTIESSSTTIDQDRAAQTSIQSPPLARPTERPTSDAINLDTDLPPIERRSGGFTIPPIALLDSPKKVLKVDERQLMANAQLLENKCREFGVEGSVAQIHPGPVVTTFEFKPEAGVKYSKVTGLSEDLCLAMEAESVLIERIPGKSTVGIQIPNSIREHISLRELLESEVYRRSTSKLPLVLGKSIHGEPLVSDLATMPHLLIAGSTGTGKSVSVNAMLTSILYRATPDDVRLILIDPKRLELGMYADIPHLLTPVVVDPKRAANALRWAVREMEERYKLLASEGVRNIEQFNRNVNHTNDSNAKELDEKGTVDGSHQKRLPYVVLAIDELADLMMVASKDVEESVARLAQMARAVGIHLILATQRPSVDVITGLIKANLPSRIAFRASSKVDSRTILDTNGAEQLLGKGDMLFLPPSSSRSIRVHGPYISENETARLASFLRNQGKPGYDTSITADEKPVSAVELESDELYEQAARIVVTSQQASVSNLQRRLRIGFSRAARLVDMMEADGIVSEGIAGKSREVLVEADYFEQVDMQLK